MLEEGGRDAVDAEGGGVCQLVGVEGKGLQRGVDDAHDVLLVLAVFLVGQEDVALEIPLPGDGGGEFCAAAAVGNRNSQDLTVHRIVGAQLAVQLQGDLRQLGVGGDADGEGLAGNGAPPAFDGGIVDGEGGIAVDADGAAVGHIPGGGTAHHVLGKGVRRIRGDKRELIINGKNGGHGVQVTAELHRRARGKDRGVEAECGVAHQHIPQIGAAGEGGIPHGGHRLRQGHALQLGAAQKGGAADSGEGGGQAHAAQGRGLEESVCGDTGDPLRDRDGGKAGAVVENAGAGGGPAPGIAEVGEPGAVPEGAGTDGVDAVGKVHPGEPGAAQEGFLANGGEGCREADGG